MKSVQILIVGGGNAGISTASQLLRKDKQLQISIVEPSEHHYYQPAWTLVGAGIYDIQKTKRRQASVMPKRVEWIRARVTSFEPEKNQVMLSDGTLVAYQYLIVATGIQMNWQEVKGLPETLGKNGVCSNYKFDTAPYTWEVLKNLKGGKAVFTSAHTAVKCGGAPHKIMWLVGDYLRKHDRLDKTSISYWSGGSRLFGVEKYEKTLLKVAERNHVNMHFAQKLVEVDGPNRRAKFVGIGKENEGQESWVEFDMLHVTPPQSAPDVVRNSALANEAGWVNVDQYTLQHKVFPNVFSLGDVAALPTAKTGAAVRKQAPVLVKNLLAYKNGQALDGKYTGYSSCPVVTGYGKLVLCEFDYTNQPKETFPIDQSKERWSMFMLKRWMLPWLYWNQILPGKM